MVGVSPPKQILSLVVAMVDISLWDKMLFLNLFCACIWLIAGGKVFFPMSQLRKCLILPLALQYLIYHIELSITAITIVPIIVIIISNQFGITKGSYSSICCKTFFTC